jgi:uncharacterized membrane protein
VGCCGGSSKKDEQKVTNSNLNPIDQLKIRLANGEISIEEYLQTKSVLVES